MAWGKQKEQSPPSTIGSVYPPSHFYRPSANAVTELIPKKYRQVLPLIITLVILGAVAWVCYLIYLSLGKIQAQARKQMGENITITKDGMRVNVQGIEAESYLDRTQNWVVKAWELGSGSNPNEHEEATKRKRFAPGIHHLASAWLTW
ncbi:hypothetical protein MYCTH_2309165 [Thermothelomyces thermophilus ATCC 42464]|uniref:Uncharacterized protein n=1 Tax=Thermothelomyces thermophilus (strain ATCC 42464 / BCRC 31852 / DSM 1799) TaxID=573729 RepID=G2QI10_THET4|nr:uncharacterized protein MYCTH_2309165 [Thermothelomyces thermophilus ATCC 42464]AEO60199.1 hypothetical protein MYCTH_2309165 [Thermothelomyces thermophilus ATCC 42464]